ncbi:MAG: hypothetical protein WCO42_01980, partial [bacterium]
GASPTIEPPTGLDAPKDRWGGTMLMLWVMMFSRTAMWTPFTDDHPALRKAESSSWCVNCALTIKSVNLLPLWMITSGLPSMTASSFLFR